MLGTLELPKGRLELGGVQGPRAGDRVRSRQSGGRGGRPQRALRGTRQARHAGGSHGAGAAQGCTHLLLSLRLTN